MTSPTEPEEERPPVEVAIVRRKLVEPRRVTPAEAELFFQEQVIEVRPARADQAP